jgi:hypothetical protein
VNFTNVKRSYDGYVALSPILEPEIKVEFQGLSLSNNAGAPSVLSGIERLSGSSLTLTLRNTGVGELFITGATLDGDSGDFSTDFTPRYLPVGQTMSLKINFNPQSSGVRRAQLAITSDDNANPSFLVNLEGFAKKQQTISFPGISDQIFAPAKRISLAARSTSSLPIAYSAVSTNIRILPDGKLEVLGAGVAEVLASQLGDSTHASAAVVSQSFVVKKATIPVQVVATSRTYNSQPIAPPKITTIPSGLNARLAYRDNFGNPLAEPPATVGTYSVLAILDHPDYEGVGSASFAINKAPAVVLLKDLQHLYDGSPKFANTATQPFGLVISILYNGQTAPPALAGRHTVLANINDPNHTGSASGTLVIAKASQSIDFPQPQQLAFELGATFPLSATSSSGLPVSFASGNTNFVAITNGIATVRGAGSIVITASQAGNGNYSAAPAVSRTLVIGKADQQIDFPEMPTQVFAPGRTFTLPGSASSKLPITFTSLNTNVLTISGKTATIRASGQVSIRAAQAGNANYTAAAR